VGSHAMSGAEIKNIQKFKMCNQEKSRKSEALT
jgi:hypothetical protein